MFSVGLDGSRYKSYGTNSIEEYLRFHGINVIHGGENSLRYTPHFGLTSAELDLLKRTLVQELSGPSTGSASLA